LGFSPLPLTPATLSKLQLGQAGLGCLGVAAGHGFAVVSFNLRQQLRWANMAMVFLLPKASAENDSGKST